MEIQPFVLYTTKFCPYCIQAKRLLKAEGIGFSDIDVTFDRSTRNKVAAELNWSTVPIILRRGELIGGYTELAALASRGELTDP